jgi:hydrogenase maturation protease
MEEQKKVLILGIGNLLLKDEGIGIHVVNRLKDMVLPPYVEVIDGGTLSNYFIEIVGGREKVIVIDSIKADGPPGTIYRLTGSDIENKRKGYYRTVFEQEFIDAWKTTYILGTQPEEVVLIGVEPEDTGEKSLMLEIGLTPTIEKRIPDIIEMVMKEIEIY